MADWKPFTPTAQAVRIMATTDPTQNKRLAVFLDQHRNAAAGFPDGRAWWGFVERAANGADMPGLVAELQPVCADSMIRGKMYKGWLAPWYPDAKYINEKIGTLDGNHFEIDYGKMETDWRAAEDAYFQRAITAALAHELPVPTMGGVVDYRVQAIVGKPPRSPRIPQAARTGHQWLLGFSTEKDEMLERLISAASGHFAMPTPEQMRTAETEADALRRQVAEMQEQMKAFFAKAGDTVIVPSAEKPKKGGRTTAAQRAAAQRAREAAPETEWVGGGSR
jgi:hypothetical protein